jgi:hypothetical protein
MAHMSHTVGRFGHPVGTSAPDTRPWIIWLARAGYAAKGVVYCVVGLLALLAAFGNGGETTGSKGALHNLMNRPFGKVTVSLLAVGLAGYALWCFVQAARDPEHDGSDGKGMAKRAWRFAKGLLHLSLVAAAIGMVTGRGSGGGGDSNIDKWTAKLMAMPWGVWLVGIVAAGVAIYGARQLWRAWKVDLDKMLALGDMPPEARRPVVNVSRFGIGARGVVFVIMGFGLGLAAYHTDPSEAKGVGESLRWLTTQPYGPWLLAIVAAGLMAYGFYEFVRAGYRVIRPEK